MMKVVVTPAWNMEMYEKQMQFPNFNNMMPSAKSQEWQQAHNVQGEFLSKLKINQNEAIAP